MLKKLLLMTATFVSAFALNSVEMNLNDKDLEFGVRLDMGQFNEAVEPDTIFLGAKLLHADKTHGDLAESNDYYELGFLMKRQVSNSDIAIGLGFKVNHTKDFTSVPLGAEVSYKLPAGDIIPMYLGGSVYFAPELLSMNNAKGFLEYRFNFDVEVIQNGLVTIGYRSLKTNYDTAIGDVTYNSSVFAGFRFVF